MPLLQLPPEVLGMIFDYIPSSAFHEDLGLLTVCKEWFEFALPVFFRDSSFHPGHLVAFASRASKSLPCFSDSIKTLHIDLATTWPAGDWLAEAEPEPEHQPGGSPAASSPRAAIRDGNAWVRQLEKGLRQLAAACRRSRMLSVLEMHASVANQTDHIRQEVDHGTRYAYIPLCPIREILSVENLSVLVLNLHAGFTRFSGSEPDRGENDHLCPLIAAHLASLKTLHVRMRTICPDVLKPPNDSHGSSRGLLLSNVVINLYQMWSSSSHSKRCGGHNPVEELHADGGGVVQLKEDMWRQAQALLGRMESSPRILRILTMSLPSFKRESLDVLTGKIMVVDTGEAWDADGESLDDESESESDLLDDDFNGFLNDSD